MLMSMTLGHSLHSRNLTIKRKLWRSMLLKIPNKEMKVPCLLIENLVSQKYKKKEKQQFLDPVRQQTSRDVAFQ